MHSKPWFFLSRYVEKHTIMKNTTLLSICLLVFTSYGQYDYKVSLQPADANKNTIFGIEEIIPTYNRHLIDNSFNFSSPVHFSPSTIDSLFRSIGIVPVSSESVRGEALVTEKAAGTDCDQALQLCSNASLPGNSGGFGTQELGAANHGCLTGNEHQSSWYYVNILVGGSLSMRINPIAADDYDFAFWGPFTAATAGVNCPPISSPVRCSYAAGAGNTGLRSGSGDVSENAFGDRWVDPLNVLAGEVYILLIDNFSVSGTGFDIDFSWGGNVSTAVLGCTPVVLPVEVASFKGWAGNGENVLNWITESETNNDYFIVESSANPEEGKWDVVSTLAGAGTTVKRTSYSYEDFTFKRNSINYYRITQVDYNGMKRVYNKMVVIDDRMEGKNLVKIVNLLGEEVDADSPGILIYCYDDGTTEKRYNQK